ncbi:hypothetical protein [Pedobacter sp. JY14-1]|uniref:hypothetical protein n=1 Tax=Pedobacter sp. JY14-1 TaxID=3034151 RepID=UPI0023E1627A|nr:hypothetical protein [Pedobacter sp. JY14-1]
MTRSNGGNAAYTYDSTGTKLKSVQGTVTREYIDGIQYTGGNLEFFTEEGRALKNGSTYSYEYNLKDHLGNVRVSFDKHPTTGVACVIHENAVGWKGQATVEGVKSFTLQLSEYVGKEIKGFSYSSNGSVNATDVLLGAYQNNYTTSYGSVGGLIKKYGDNFSFNNVL